MPQSRPFPEIMRTVRHLGAPRSNPRHQRLHDRWFAPLLDARTAAQRASTDGERVAMLGADRLEAAYQRAMAEIARGEASGGAPEQRALEARIEDAAAEMFANLAAQRIVEDRLSQEGGTGTEATWSEWIDALRATTAAIDAAFPVVCEVVERAAQ